MLTKTNPSHPPTFMTGQSVKIISETNLPESRCSKEAIIIGHSLMRVFVDNAQSVVIEGVKASITYPCIRYDYARWNVLFRYRTRLTIFMRGITVRLFSGPKNPFLESKGVWRLQLSDNTCNLRGLDLVCVGQIR